MGNGELNGTDDDVPEPDANDDDSYISPDDADLQKEGMREEVSFTSRLPRFFFPCRSDDEALKNILNSVIERTLLPIGNRMEYHYMLLETYIPCRECQMDLNAATAIQRIHRRANLHTLHHGSLIVEVAELKCPGCLSYNPYDRYSDGLFSSSKMHMFTRELLDS